MAGGGWEMGTASLVPPASPCPLAHLAISHLLTSSPRLGIQPMPRWGSLLVKVLRKWM